MQLILGSQSPRRRELLGLLRRPFTVRVADIDETMDPGRPPCEEVARVSRLKAEAIPRTPEDVVIGISFPRYSSRTVHGMKFAKDQGATTIAITDSEVSPLAPISTYTLTARSDMVSFVDSLVAPLSIINAMIVSVARKDPATVRTKLQKLEQIWEEYEVYETNQG